MTKFPKFLAKFIDRQTEPSQQPPEAAESVDSNNIDMHNENDTGTPAYRPGFNPNLLAGTAPTFEISQLTEMLELDPNNEVAFLNRGALYRERGEYKRAIADFTEAIRIIPTSSYPYIERGRSFEADNQLFLAILDFSYAAELSSRSGTLFGISELYLIERCIAKLKPSKNEHPITGTFGNDLVPEARDSRPFEPSPELNDTRAAALAVTPETSINETGATRRDQHGTPRFLERGTMLREKGELKLAIKEFTDLIKLYPDTGQTYLERGITLAENKEYGLAIADFLSAIRTGQVSERVVIYTFEEYFRDFMTPSREGDKQQTKTGKPGEKDEGLLKEPLKLLLTSWGVPEDKHAEYAALFERIAKGRVNSASQPDAQQANIQFIIASIMQKIPGYRIPEAPVHPGILIDRLLEHMQIPVAKAAEPLEITREQLYRVIRGTSALSPRLADTLEKAAWGGRAEEWLFVQNHFDLAQLRRPDRPKARPRRTIHKESRP
jgi:addiction module HigA family antidote